MLARRLIPVLPLLLLCGLTVCTIADDESTPRPIRARPPVFPQTLIDLFSREVQTSLPEARPVQPVAPQAPANFNWSRLIDADTLEDEIKSYKPILAAELKSASAFKSGGAKKCGRALSMLAVCFAIGAEYDGAFRWKSQAPGARDVFARGAAACDQPTDATFEIVKARAQDLDALLRGDALPESQVGPITSDWRRVTERTQLMGRMEDAQQRGLSVWTASEAYFAKNADKIHREAMILAALSEVIARPSFDFSDDKAFVNYALTLQKNATDVLAGLKANNYEQVRRAVSSATRSCTACHGAYR